MAARSDSCVSIAACLASPRLLDLPRELLQLARGLDSGAGRLFPGAFDRAPQHVQIDPQLAQRLARHGVGRAGRASTRSAASGSRPSLRRSSWLRPTRRSPRSAFSSFSQLRNVTSEIPKSLASLRGGRSANRAKRIASRRNSSGYGGLVLGTRTSLSPAYDREAFTCRRKRIKSNGVTMLRRPRPAAHFGVCTADDSCPNRSGMQDVADAEVVTLAVAQEILGIDHDAESLALARRLLGHLLPKLRNSPAAGSAASDCRTRSSG